MGRLRYLIGEFWHCTAGSKMHNRYAFLLFVYIIGVVVIFASLPSMKSQKDQNLGYYKNKKSASLKLPLGEEIQETGEETEICQVKSQENTKQVFFRPWYKIRNFIFKNNISGIYARRRCSARFNKFRSVHRWNQSDDIL